MKAGEYYVKPKELAEIINLVASGRITMDTGKALLFCTILANLARG